MGFRPECGLQTEWPMHSKHLHLVIIFFSKVLKLMYRNLFLTGINRLRVQNKERDVAREVTINNNPISAEVK